MKLNAPSISSAMKTPGFKKASSSGEPAQSNTRFEITFHHDSDRGFGSKMGTVIFESCTGLSTEIDVRFIGDAQSAMSSRAVRGSKVTGTITFGKTLQGGSSEFAKWLLDVLDFNKKLKRMNLLITIKSTTSPHQVLEKWKVQSAWPCAWNGPMLDSGTTGVALESLTFVHEGVLPVLD